jgi:hypothetical protein
MGGVEEFPAAPPPRRLTTVRADSLRDAGFLV